VLALWEQTSHINNIKKKKEEREREIKRKGPDLFQKETKIK